MCNKNIEIGFQNAAFHIITFLFEKRPLAITAMNAELPFFRNGKHNFESMVTLDRSIIPLISGGI